MGTGCSSPSRRVSNFHRKISSIQSSRYEWSISEPVRPISSPGNLHSLTASASSSSVATSNGLSLIEAHLLRKMWPSNSIEQSYELGLEIFEEIFRLEPDVRDFFPCLRKSPPSKKSITVSTPTSDATKIDKNSDNEFENLNRNVANEEADEEEKVEEKEIPPRCVGEFRSHVIRFVSVLTICVKYCDQPQQLDDRLFELGRRHRRYVPQAQIKHFRVFEKALSMVMRRRSEQHGVEEQLNDTDSGYSGGISNTLAWHPSSPMDRTSTVAKFRNPKEQVRATIAWTSLAAYVVRQILNGFNSEDDKGNQKGGTKT